MLFELVKVGAVLSILPKGMYCYGITNLSFPSSFLFGIATPSIQIEGAWNEFGKIVSRWDHITHTIKLVVDGSNADVACDSYHKYRDDIAIVKELGVNFYKCSIAWTRILPSGFNNGVNDDGVRYYNNLIDGLLEAGIEPWFGWYAYPLVYGDDPRVMMDTIGNLSFIQGSSRSRLPTKEKLDLKGAYDFIALNHYTTSLTADTSWQIKKPSFINDGLVHQFKDQTLQQNSCRISVTDFIGSNID